MLWFAAAFVLAVAAAVALRRNELARVQALVMGGMITAGCVVAEAVILLSLAIATIESPSPRYCGEKVPKADEGKVV